MSTLDRTMQGLAVAGGALMMLSGFALAASTVDAASGVMVILLGAALAVGAALQRNRYRSLAAERAGQPPGPGGGEGSPLEPRFAPTPELFVDPTTGRLMRVFADARNGERRYIAEA
jgi:hypothetical protein